MDLLLFSDLNINSLASPSWRKQRKESQHQEPDDQSNQSDISTFPDLFSLGWGPVESLFDMPYLCTNQAYELPASVLPIYWKWPHRLKIPKLHGNDLPNKISRCQINILDFLITVLTCRKKLDTIDENLNGSFLRRVKDRFFFLRYTYTKCQRV